MLNTSKTVENDIVCLSVHVTPFGISQQLIVSVRRTVGQPCGIQSVRTCSTSRNYRFTNIFGFFLLVKDSNLDQYTGIGIAEIWCRKFDAHQLE